MIILTGHSGFIGKNFLNVLKDTELLLIEKENSSKFIKEFDSWDKVDLIIHQGAISSTTEKDIRLIYGNNVNFTLFLFEYAIKYQIPVKYASSASIYGNTLKEINPLNQYAISKLQIDYYVLENIDKFSLIQGFRYFNVYGEGEDHKGDQASPISKFTKQIKETGQLNLFKGSDKFLRDFICVDDIVNIVMNNSALSGIYDLGTGYATSFQEVAEMIIKKENGKIKYIDFPKNLEGKYQNYTCADMNWIGNYKFKTIREYLHI